MTYNLHFFYFFIIIQLMFTSHRDVSLGRKQNSYKTFAYRQVCTLYFYTSVAYLTAIVLPSILPRDGAVSKVFLNADDADDTDFFSLRSKIFNSRIFISLIIKDISILHRIFYLRKSALSASSAFF